MYYVVAYDITDDRRRNRILKILKDFGVHIQYSVFECNTDRRAYLRLKERLSDAMHPEEDSMTFYHLCRSCKNGMERMGVKKGLDKKSYVV